MEQIINYEHCFTNLQSALAFLDKRACLAVDGPIAKAFQNKQILGIVSGGYQNDLKNERWIGLTINQRLSFMGVLEPNEAFFYLQEELCNHEVTKLKNVLLSVLTGDFGILAHFDDVYSNKYPFHEVVRDNQATAYRKISHEGLIEEGVSVLLDTDQPTKLLVEFCSEGNPKVFMLSPVDQGQLYFGDKLDG